MAKVGDRFKVVDFSTHPQNWPDEGTIEEIKIILAFGELFIYNNGCSCVSSNEVKLIDNQLLFDFMDE